MGVSVERQEPLRPQKPFGKPRGKQVMLAPLPPGYLGLGGSAGQGPGLSRPQCADFFCGAGQTVVGDTSTNKYYRCHCPAAKNIALENVQCITTPAIAERI